ncbi:RNA polymerase-associated protein CTR9 [Abeliophyllum distichum]|uniref:RNA polymerase-associated protein CTR9 n=1 Tax=Abeliophyllum distichum TaxID=126358 RepID=A0ABD1PTP0_9LAMI
MRDSTIKEKYFKKYDSISTESVENVSKELPSDTVDKDMRHSESNEEILKRLAEIEVKLQSNEEILKRLAEIEVKVESNDIILKRLTDIESKIQSNEEIQNRLAELEMKVQSNIQMEKQIKELEEKTDDEVTLNAPLKRQKKPTALLQCPWVNQYDSAVGTSMVGASTVGTTKRVLKGTSAFKVGLFSPCGSDMEAFESWYKVKHFNDDNITISPCLYFSDIAISSKMWWLELVTTNEALDDTHMDVCFYYLRKLLRYGPGIKINATTIDFAFDSQVRGLYDDFSKDPLVLVKQTSLLSYPIRLYMPCNTSWREVDHVLIPLRMYNSAYWIPCHFDIKEMCLNIYNSYTKIVKEPVVLEAVRPFSVMIPYLLFHTRFFEGKNISEQEALKPLVVKMVPKLPQQKNEGNTSNKENSEQFLKILEEGSSPEIDEYYADVRYERIAILNALGAYYSYLGNIEIKQREKEEHFNTATQYYNKASKIDMHEPSTWIGKGRGPSLLHVKSVFDFD